MMMHPELRREAAVRRFFYLLGVAGMAALGAGAVLVIVLLLSLFLWRPAGARDLGQWENHDPAVRAWFQALMQPDNPGRSCCGEGDAYWADEVHYANGQVIAVITDTRDDEPLGRMHEEPGTEYVVPPEKITRRDGNPTGHVLIFLGTKSWDQNNRLMQPRDVLCYVMNGGV